MRVTGSMIPGRIASTGTAPVALYRDIEALVHPDSNQAMTYANVYSIDSGSNHLQETYLPAIGSPWNSQDLSAKYGTPAGSVI
jgi:hypothetical protein